MSIPLSDRARLAVEAIEKEPNLVLEIEGVDTKYGAVKIQKRIKIGDPGLLIGDGWKIGGLRDIEDQLDVISFKDGTSTSITQQLEPDKGAAASITNMQVALIDRNEEITRLVTPGEIVEDVLGRRCKLWFVFKGTAFPEDAFVIFRGIIQTINAGAGVVVLDISHPDQKKKQELYVKGETKLTTPIAGIGAVGTIDVETTDGFFLPITGPDGTISTMLTCGIRIDQEVFTYTGKTATSFTGVTRAQATTGTQAHALDAEITSFYILEGELVDLALATMLGGWNGYFKTGYEITNFNYIGDGDFVSNAIFFEGVNIFDELGIVEGDYITTTGASDGANNVTLEQIETIEITDLGTYIVISGVSFVNEVGTAATISFRSQYDILPEEAALKMYPDEVDIAEHLRLNNIFLAGLQYRFYLTDTIEGKTLLNEEIYLPGSCYSLPRKSKSSLGFHSPPIPNEEVIVLNENNIVKPSGLKLTRGMSKNFYNTIVVKFDESPYESDKFLSGRVTVSNTSKNQIPVGTRAFVIKSKGYRSDLGAASKISNTSNRRIKRYQFGAEAIDKIEVFFGTGLSIEPGDIFILDGTNLQIANTKDANRQFGQRLFEVRNKTLKLNGNVELAVVDTNFNGASRYGLISPSSYIASGISGTQFTIKKSFGGALYGVNEYRKWNKYKNMFVIVRSYDWATVSSPVEITNVTGNTITVSPSLGFTPSADMVMELAKYDFQNDQVKLIYAFMTDAATFTDGKPQFVLI